MAKKNMLALSWVNRALRHGAGSRFLVAAATVAILALAALAVSHAQLATPPWPMFQHDVAHTGLSQYDTSGNPGKQKWAFAAGDVSLSAPAIGADGTIYIGSANTGQYNDGLYALNPDGTQKWAFVIFGFGYSPAIGADGTIYFGTATGSVYAVNPDGTQKWIFPAGDGLEGSAPTIGADGTIYIVANNAGIGVLYALTDGGQATVTEKWAFPTASETFNFSPAVGADGTIYVNSLDCILHAVNPDGTQKWASLPIGRALNCSASPAIGTNGTIYLPSGSLYAVNPDGTEKWAFSNPNYAFGDEGSPAIGADGTIYIGSDLGGLYAITDTTCANPSPPPSTIPCGVQKWVFPTAGEVPSSPAIGADGTIYIGDNDGNLYAVNPDGTQKWAFATGGAFYPSSAIGADGTIYIASEEGNLYAVGIASPTPTPSPTPTVPSGLGPAGGTVNPQASVGEPVSTGNGNYTYTHSDFALPGRGLPLVFARSYNTLDNYAGPLGANWTHSYNIILTPFATSAVVKWGDGHAETFTLSGGTYVPQPGVFSTLCAEWRWHLHSDYDSPDALQFHRHRSARRHRRQERQSDSSHLQRFGQSHANYRCGGPHPDTYL